MHKLHWFILGAVLGGCRAKEPIAVWPACGAALEADADWPLVALPNSHMHVQLPPRYIERDTIWVGPDAAQLMIRRRDQPSLPADSMTTCHVTIAAHAVRWARSAEYADAGLEYVTVAEWESAPGTWLQLVGIARTARGQAEHIAVLYSLVP